MRTAAFISRDKFTLLPYIKSSPVGKIQKVLHVATELYRSGGHSQVLKAFVLNDPTREHHLFDHISKFKGSDQVRLVEYGMPFVKKNIHWCNAEILREECGMQLRKLAYHMDLVILHIHPNDIVPAIAFSYNYSGPPVALLDHADTNFWVGASVIDAHFAIRDVSKRAAETFRGIPANRSFRLPIPLLKSDTNKQSARYSLGIGKNTILLLSAASPYKFDRILWDLVAPIVAEFPNVVWKAFGPRQWHSKRLNTTQFQMEDNIHQQLLNLYHAAADIHIDSFPFASLTSALNTLINGGVVLSFCPWQNVSDIALCLTPEDYAAVNETLTCPSSDLFTSTLRNLLGNLTKLREMGQEAQRKMTERHHRTSWSKEVTKIYEKVLQLPRRKPMLN
jgi:hypothetical protein